MKNKSQVPEALILVATIIICGYSLYVTYSFENSYAQKLSVPSALLEAYNAQDSFEIYAMESARISADEAFSKISKQNSECPLVANDLVPIWSETCGPSKNKLNENFAKEINSKMKSLTDRNFKISIDDKIKFEFEPITVNLVEYNGTYQYKTEFSIENPMTQDFESIYKQVISQVAECKKATPFADCMNKMKFNDWTIDCKPSSYLICSLKTKSNYFYGESFGKIESKFALKN